MNFNSLKQKLNNYPIFKLEDIFKWFPNTDRQTVLNQILGWKERGYLEELRRGVYKLSEYEVNNNLILANFIYPPSYISMETALNYYSIIPDIPFETTSVSLKKTKRFNTACCGVFSYKHIKSTLFFGSQAIYGEKNYSYNIALPEKALFDYFYLNSRTVFDPENFVGGLRLSLSSDFNKNKLREWSNLISPRRKKFHQLIEVLLK